MQQCIPNKCDGCGFQIPQHVGMNLAPIEGVNESPCRDFLLVVTLISSREGRRLTFSEKRNQLTLSMKGSHMAV